MARVDVNIGPIGAVHASIGAAVAVAAAVIVAATVGTSSSVTANLWVDTTTSGNTCTRTAGVGAEYATNSACSTFDAAWDAASSGDTIRVKSGQYGYQLVTGNKTSETRFVGEGDGDDALVKGSGDCIVGGEWGAFCAEGNFMTLENLTIEIIEESGRGGGNIKGSNVTYRNVDIRGEVKTGGRRAVGMYIDGPNFTWDGGSHGVDGETGGPLQCTHASVQGVVFGSSGDGAVIDGVRFNPQTVQTSPTQPNVGTCGGDGVPHFETFRFEDADNVIIRDSWLVDGSVPGSGHIYSSSDPDNTLIVNTVFGERGGDLTNGVIQFDPIATESGWTFAHVTMLDDGGIVGDNTSTFTWVGNFGYPFGGCAGTQTKNVWAGSGSCSTNTYIGATAFGVTVDGHLNAGSPAIDAAEASGGSSYCPGTDRDGDSRPVGSACDAGADERTS